MRILSLLSPLKGLSQIMSNRQKYTLIYAVEEGDTFRILSSYLIPSDQHQFCSWFYQNIINRKNQAWALQITKWSRSGAVVRALPPMFFYFLLLFFFLYNSLLKQINSTNVARVQIPASTPYAGWVCFWFSSLLREVFLRVLRFSPLLKNQHFQIPIWPGIR